MAIALFDGQKVLCTPVRPVNGTTGWIMSSCQHTARLVHGTHFRVSAGEIVEMAEWEAGVPGSSIGVTIGPNLVVSLLDVSPEYRRAATQQLLRDAQAAERGDVLPNVVKDIQRSVDDGISRLEAAMAKERETLPTPAQVIRDNQPIAHDAPNKVET